MSPDTTVGSAPPELLWDTPHARMMRAAGRLEAVRHLAEDEHPAILAAFMAHLPDTVLHELHEQYEALKAEYLFTR